MAGWKASAKDAVRRMQEAGAEVFFDPETHALQTPAVGDWRYYDEWDLWPAAGRRLDTDAHKQEHLRRVFGVQDDLGVPRLAPTILLHSAQSTSSTQALELAHLAIDADPRCVLAIVGDGTFWAAGSALDAHIGALAQLEPAGWWLTVARPLAILPASAVPSEIHGLCRTARALSEDAPVHISHGDLAGLPAISAGAATLGTGWDPRQRVSAYASYAARDPDAEGGSWFGQVTLEGVLSLLVGSEIRVLADRAPALAAAMLPGTVPPGPKEAWEHHARLLHQLVQELDVTAAGAYDRLRDRYLAARAQWPSVASAVGVANGVDAWVTPLLDGLEAFGRTEGF
ncbi:MAG: hypothetical protein WKF96_21915 [Solirubrobacteraceae bacterium]